MSKLQSAPSLFHQLIYVVKLLKWLSVPFLPTWPSFLRIHFSWCGFPLKRISLLRAICFSYTLGSRQAFKGLVGLNSFFFFNFFISFVSLLFPFMITSEWNFFSLIISHWCSSQLASQAMRSSWCFNEVGRHWDGLSPMLRSPVRNVPCLNVVPLFVYLQLHDWP